MTRGTYAPYFAPQIGAKLGDVSPSSTDGAAAVAAAASPSAPDINSLLDAARCVLGPAGADAVLAPVFGCFRPQADVQLLRRKACMCVENGLAGLALH